MRHSRRAAVGAVALWLVALAGALAVTPRLPSVAVTDPIRFFPADAPNRVAAEALEGRFPDAAAASQVVVVLEAEPPGTAIAPARERIAELAARLRRELPAEELTSVLAPTDGPVQADRLLSRDGEAALVVVQLRAGFASEAAGAIASQVERSVPEVLAGAGLRASYSGHATLGRDYLSAIEAGARRSALATVALVVVMLLLVHRAPLAALVSLATLGTALGVTTGVVTLAAELGLPVAFQARGFLVATVYGVGTDYCLLLLARTREEGSLPDAVRASAPVLVTSAAAVAVACALMGGARFGLFADTGPALALGVLVTLAAVLTLAPALMTLAGRALFWPRRLRSAAPPGAETADRGVLWPAIARLVLRRPVAVLLGVLALVLPLAALGLRVEPSYEIELDIPQPSVSWEGWSALVRHFEPAQVGTLTLVLDSAPEGVPLRSTAGLDALYQLTEWLAAEPGVARVWSATRPTGAAGLLGRATLRSQLGELAAGLGSAREGALELATGLEGARRGLERGRSALADKQREVEEERRSSLLGAFAPGRFEAAQRDLEALRGQLGSLEAGLARAGEGARSLAEGVGLGEQRLRDLGASSGSARVLDRLALTPEDVAATPELERALGWYLSADARAARFELELAANPNAPAAVETLGRLRSGLGVLAPALGLAGARVLAVGPTPITADLAALTRADLARLDRWILLGVFALLVALLRGIAAPAAITAFILLSYFAALGALELLVAAGAWPGLDWKTPFFLFVLLVAIGADYGVFLLGRAREEALRLPYAAALARSLEATGPVVTSCGLVLAGTFCALSLARIAFLEQVGIGITVGVLIDTGLVRPFLLPAAALLLGRPAAPSHQGEIA